MKNASKLACVLGCALLAGAFGIVMMNITSGLSINTTVVDKIHNIKLKDLYLAGNSEEGTNARIAAGEHNLNIQNGLIVHGDGYKTSELGLNLQMVVIGGGDENNIGLENTKNSGIVGGYWNKIGEASQGVNSYGFDSAAIGGGYLNKLHGSNSVIAGGSNNKTTTNAVIIGGDWNEASNQSVVLGGVQNKALGGDSIILGSGAQGLRNTFVWNDGFMGMENYAAADSAYIGADNGVLIGTYEAKDGVKLVVNGAVKIGSEDTDNAIGGEIMQKNGCFYAYDGDDWHIMGTKNNCEDVDVATCKFGNVTLQNGDVVDVYPEPFSQDCEATKVNVTCKGEDIEGYPYCYQIGDFIDVVNENLVQPGGD